MARKRRVEEPENHERWLVSYADFITLLFAFFVVLYAISQVDLKKLSQAAKSFGNSFGGSTEVTGESDPSKRVDPDAWRYAPIFPSVIKEQPAEESPGGEQEEVRRRLQQMLRSEKLDGGVRVTLDARGVVVRMEPKALFRASTSSLSSDGARLLDRLGAVVRTVGSPVLVIGHAAPPAATDLAGSFERSTARAAAVGRQLVMVQRIPASSLFLMGEGEAARKDGERDAGRRLDGEIELVLIRKGQVREQLREAGQAGR